jgi:menaquinone-specific isochorismate synthase
VTLRVYTERLNEDRALLDLMDLVPDERPFVFVQEGEGIVAGGTALDVPVGTGPRRLAAARAALRASTADADVAGDPSPVATVGSGLVAVGAFTFDPSADGSTLRIPRVVVGRRGDVTWRTTVEVVDRGAPVGHAERGTTEHPDAGREDGDGSTASTDRPRYAGSTLDDTAWLEAVAVAVAAIRSGELAKVVLARDLMLWSRAPFDVRAVLAGLAARFPSCFTFRDGTLVGASPELLLRRNGSHVASRVLAGTAPRGGDVAADDALGAELLASTKDRWEHDLAARSAAEVLAAHCADLVVPGGPSLVRLDNVQHLGSDLTGTLDADVHLLDLLDELHPTAAVAGTPRDVALARIPGLERMDRGRYAGPVGWCTPDGDGEFAIALRCAEVDGTRARLFAGAGVVADSLPEAELRETWLKLRAMTDALGAEPVTRR